MKGIKGTILKFDSYSVAQDFSRIKLNQNESPLDMPTEIKEEVFKRLNEAFWNRYPSAAASLIEKISIYTGFPSPGIVVGNGSNELIQTLVYAICDSGDRILAVQPGFSIYKRVASVMNIAVMEVPLQKDFSFDVEAIIEKGKKAKLMILASPNNPTGTVLKVEEIERIARNFDGIVAVDEAYYEFYKETCQELVDKLENIVVIRTFSKALGLAGVRLGYLLGREEMARALFKARLPFSLGIFQQVAGEVVLEKKRFIEAKVEKIIKERERLLRELEKIRFIRPIPSYANFILFESKNQSGKDLYQRLFEKGVVLRYFDVPRMKNMLRVTVDTPNENDTFLEKMKQIAEGSIS